MEVYPHVGHHPGDSADYHSSFPAGISGMGAEESVRDLEAAQHRSAFLARTAAGYSGDDAHVCHELRSCFWSDSAHPPYHSRSSGGEGKSSSRCGGGHRRSAAALAPRHQGRQGKKADAATRGSENGSALERARQQGKQHEGSVPKENKRSQRTGEMRPSGGADSAPPRAALRSRSAWARILPVSWASRGSQIRK